MIDCELIGDTYLNRLLYFKQNIAFHYKKTKCKDEYNFFKILFSSKAAYIL